MKGEGLMHCLVCGEKLRVRQRRQYQDFCSEAHRRLHNQLTLARLLELEQKREEPPAEPGFRVDCLRPVTRQPEPPACAGALLFRGPLRLPANRRIE